MFRLVLIPLDGSLLAEAVLPAAAAVARALQAEVKLLHAIEPRAPAMVHGHRHLRDADEAEAYLREVARRPVFQGQVVAVHVHLPTATDVADAIVDHAREFGADLVALSTHGRGGLREALFGSIALQALQRGTTPILLVRPSEPGSASPFVCRKILVPLDGTPGHEAALPVASTLARAWEAAVHLELIVPTVGTLSGPQAATGVLLPTATRHVLDLAAADAERYVDRLAAALAAESLPTSRHVGRGDPATCLTDAAAAVTADLVVLATHAKGALDAFWSGSLTPKAMAALHRPILLVRAADERESVPSGQRSR